MATTSLKDYLGSLEAMRDQPLGELDLDKLLEKIGCGDDFKRIVSDIDNRKLETITLKDRVGYLHEWLRFSQSDSTLAHMRWSYLAEKAIVKSRDKFTSKLWEQVSPAKGAGTFGDQFKEYVEQTWCDWPYYEKHFFGWLLSRFDLASARAIYTAARVSQWIDFLLAATAAVACGILGPKIFNFKISTAALVILIVLLAITGLTWARDKSRGLPFCAFINSLVPRLGAAVGIGYLFLASAQHLVVILSSLRQGPWFFWSASAALLVVAFLYIAFHISRRVHPRLEMPALLRRSASVLALAVTYALFEVLIAGPILFSDAFLCGTQASDCNPHRELGRLILCAAIALNLGVILQLAWDEKPLTEPL
jgi:ABC-type multidrug transport system fused ATPase/permease subunit